jgi:hypothetical protein
MLTSEDDPKRDNPVQVRFTDEEYKTLLEVARKLRQKRAAFCHNAVCIMLDAYRNGNLSTPEIAKYPQGLPRDLYLNEPPPESPEKR